MDMAMGWSAAMPLPNPILFRRRMPNWMPDLREIDWKDTGALLGVLLTVGLILKTLLRPFAEKVIYALLKERLERFDKVEELARTNTDKLEALEAALIAQGTVLRDMPRLIGSVETLSSSVSGLDESIKVMHEDVQGIREWRKYMEGVWDGQERRQGPRRADDQR